MTFADEYAIRIRSIAVLLRFDSDACDFGDLTDDEIRELRELIKRQNAIFDTAFPENEVLSDEEFKAALNDK